MRFEVYCDESFVDLFTSATPKAKYMLIGSLWLPSELRKDVKQKITDIRKRHGAWGEIKWVKVSPAKFAFYRDLVDLFFAYDRDMRFRCIAIDNNVYNSAFHGGDNELGFYKFYYQMLKHWILDGNEYSIFCDLKSNRNKDRMRILHRYLEQANMLASVVSVQAVPSSESVLIQFSDLLLGLASRSMNNRSGTSQAKNALLKYFEEKLGQEISPTARNAYKFNIFKIHLSGGW